MHLSVLSSLFSIYIYSFYASLNVLYYYYHKISYISKFIHIVYVKVDYSLIEMKNDFIFIIIMTFIFFILYYTFSFLTTWECNYWKVIYYYSIIITWKSWALLYCKWRKFIMAEKYIWLAFYISYIKELIYTHTIIPFYMSKDLYCFYKKKIILLNIKLGSCNYLFNF